MNICPFCNFDEGWVKDLPDGKFKVECKVCGGSGPKSNSREFAEDKWDGILLQMPEDEFAQALDEEMGGASSPMSNTVNTPGVGNATPASTAAMSGGQQYDPTAIGSGDKWGEDDTKKKKRKKKTSHKIASVEEYANKIRKF